MNILDITCKNSVSCSRKFCIIESNLLYLGGYQNYISYLYFDLSCLSDITCLKTAKLVLFKYKDPQHLPQQSCYKNQNHQYSIAPLLDIFNHSTCLYSIPKVDCNKKILFDYDEISNNTEIDITKIVQAWLTNQIKNRGFILVAENYSNLIAYTSEKDCNPKIRPLIRFIYEDKTISRQLSSVPCMITVKSH